MKKIAVLAVLLLASSAFADQITITYGFGGTNSVDASLSGVALGPALNLNVSDQRTGQVFTLGGASASSTGASTSFLVLTSPNVVLANFGAGGSNSVLVTDGMGNILISGVMESRGSLVSTYPGGTGGFQGDFTVTSVAPSLLAMFGLGPAFLTDGSVSATYGNANLAGTDHLTAAVGGGSVTIQTPTPVPEAMGLGVIGMVMLGGVAVVRRRTEA